MKAIQVRQFGGPEVMKLEDVPDPKPGSTQILVRVKAAGVNPVDTYHRSGITASKPPLPYTPGTDAAGVVEAVGANVTDVSAGDHVYIIGSVGGTYCGAYAELVLCESWQVQRLPKGLSFAQGAAIGIPYATAYRALFIKARPAPGETVLVHGASGGVGLASLQLARAFGLKVIGTAGTERGKKLVQEQGAHHVLDHTQADYLDKLMKLTDGRGVDVVLEMAAHINLGKSLTILAKNGRVVVIGSRGPVQINPRDTMGRDAVILGMMLWNGSREEILGIHAGLGAGFANGTLRPVIGKELPLKDAAKSHEEVMKPGAYGKIVLIP